MPKLGSQSLQQHNAGHFGFSAAKIEDLGATEYTLVTIVADRSGSTHGFQQNMEAVLKEVIGACQKSPRADNLLVRYISFSSHHQEEHGFELLSSLVPDQYDGTLPPAGSTSLFDASVDAIEASNNYGKQLTDQDFDVNGIVFVITDGEDNISKTTANQVKAALEQAVKGENLESMVSVLIGVNVQDPYVAAALNDFNNTAGFTQYVELDNANKNTLAKLAQFVSKSISSQSQALGSGGPSQSIVF
ncbi:MAG: hypothetical protein DWQ19_11995 [Crenarchaeota archaeon]|nr:MAG: hypothetical protein DWQ19_11995 [Thermoproteota archaeon]